MRDVFFPLDSCSACRFRFAREPGYYSGVLMPVLPILALATGLFSAGIFYFFFQATVEELLRIGVAGTFTGLALFCRTAIAIFIALDHLIDPPRESSRRV